MAGGRPLSAGDIPTPGPGLVRGAAHADALLADQMLGFEPAMPERPGGWPYLIRRDRPVEPGGCPLHIATGIQRLADARLIAAAPDLAAALLRLLTAPELAAANLDPRTRRDLRAGWKLLVRVAPHLRLDP